MYFLIVKPTHSYKLGINTQSTPFKVYNFFTPFENIEPDDNLLLVDLPLEEFINCSYFSTYMLIEKIIIQDLSLYPLNNLDTYKLFNLHLPTLTNCIELNQDDLITYRLNFHFYQPDLINSLNYLIKNNRIDIIEKIYQVCPFPDSILELIANLAIEKYNSLETIKFLDKIKYYVNVENLLVDYNSAKGEIKFFLNQLLDETQDDYEKLLIAIITRDINR